MSAIEWTDTTWNPVLGCSMARGSETGGCLHCYAARMAMRNLWPGEPYARMTKSGPRWTGKVELQPERLSAPLSWRKPCRVFVNSMSDLFHEALPDEAIARVFGVMARAEAHTFQVLTKRPARMVEWLRWIEQGFQGAGVGGTRLDSGRTCDQREMTWPLPNVWLGVSVEDQATADERIPLLLQTPAAVRFVSVEPLLGPVDLTRIARTETGYSHPELAETYFDSLRGEGTYPSRITGIPIEVSGPRLDWVIVGGESGPGARPFELAWARSVRDQCREAGVAFFYKQGGSSNRCEHSAKGGCLDCAPEDLRVREMPRCS